MTHAWLESNRLLTSQCSGPRSERRSRQHHVGRCFLTRAAAKRACQFGSNWDKRASWCSAGWPIRRQLARAAAQRSGPFGGHFEGRFSMADFRLSIFERRFSNVDFRLSIFERRFSSVHFLSADFRETIFSGSILFWSFRFFSLV